MQMAAAKRVIIFSWMVYVLMAEFIRVPFYKTTGILVGFGHGQYRGFIVQVAHKCNTIGSSVGIHANGHAYYRVAGEVGHSQLVAHKRGHYNNIVLLHKI